MPNTKKNQRRQQRRENPKQLQIPKPKPVRKISNSTFLQIYFNGLRKRTSTKVSYESNFRSRSKSIANRVKRGKPVSPIEMMNSVLDELRVKNACEEQIKKMGLPRKEYTPPIDDSDEEDDIRIVLAHFTEYDKALKSLYDGRARGNHRMILAQWYIAEEMRRVAHLKQWRTIDAAGRQFWTPERIREARTCPVKMEMYRRWIDFVPPPPLNDKKEELEDALNKLAIN